MYSLYYSCFHPKSHATIVMGKKYFKPYMFSSSLPILCVTVLFVSKMATFVFYSENLWKHEK